MAWKLIDGTAEQSAGIWNIRSHLTAPQQGWRIDYGNAFSCERMLAISCSVPMPAFEEAYCPEQDLVARYPQTQEPSVSLDVRYRLVSASASRLVLQATWAIQTRGFEAHPSLEIAVPRLPPTEIATINRCQADGYHSALVIHPADVAGARRVGEGDASRVQFFGDFMERGVIRKCRMRLIFSPVSGEELQCERELESLLAQPLPLVS